jgi:anti-sigma regulatory factor (Ser/Thr protein kinase)
MGLGEDFRSMSAAEVRPRARGLVAGVAVGVIIVAGAAFGLRRGRERAAAAAERAEQSRLRVERLQELAASLQAVTEALAAAATPSDVGSAIVRQGVAAVGARAAMVYALTEDGESLELVTGEGYPAEVLGARERIPVDAGTPVTDALRSRNLIVCASFEETAAYDSWFERAGGSFVAAPLIVAGRAVGAVLISSFEEFERTAADLSIVVSVARQAAQALDRAQLFEREQASTDRLRKLQAVTAALSKAVTTEDVTRTCLEHAAAAVSALEGFVVLRHPGTGTGASTLAVVASIGVERSSVEIPVDAAASIAACMTGGRSASSEGDWTAFSLASGALAVRLPAERDLAAADCEWLVTLVSQGALALDRAGRYETEREIAETLQRSVLPERLPALHGVKLAARYLPGTVGVEVGGDWYDAIHLEDGRIGLVVGDVVGKGVQAAATMGQLRNALRAFAFEHNDPDEVVSRLGKLVDGMTEAPFATLAYLVVDPRGRGVRYVVAGHPPPLIRAPDGTTAFLDGGRTLPIGVDASLSFEAGDVQLEAGSTIVLYTDGLVERRGRPLDEGLDLLTTSATETDSDPEELVDTLIAALIGEDERPDDVAVLALRFTSAVIDDLRLVVGATQDGLVEMRHALRAWLREANTGSDATAEVVLAAWEACANAVEHAQRPSQPTVGLRAMLDDAGWIRIEVRDSGQWKPSHGSADRGLGLTLMRSLMDTVEVNTSDEGTTIVMERCVDLTAEV